MKFIRFIIFLFFLSFFSFTVLLTFSGSLRQQFFAFVDKALIEMKLFSKDFSLTLDGLFSPDVQEPADSLSNSSPPKKTFRQPRVKSSDSANKPKDVKTGEGGSEMPRSLEIVSASDSQTIADNETGGFIFVQSIPENGRVSIDGQDVGTAPVTVKVREPGDYRVRVDIKYYDPYELITRVNRSEVSKVNAYLRLGKGLLTIVSSPQEATVKLNGKVEGKTPLTLPALTAGEYRVYVQKEDKEYSGTVEILAGDSKVLNVTLKQMRTDVAIHSEPADANIYLNGIAFGKTPHTIEDLKAGRYQLILEKDGSLAFVDSITVEPGGENMFGGRLTDKKHYGDVFTASLRISSGMKDVFVRVNSRTYGEAPVEIKNLRSGEHNILIFKGMPNGIYYYETEIFLQPNEKRAINIPKEMYQFKKIGD